MQRKEFPLDYLPSVSSISDVMEMMPCVVFILQFTGNRSAAMPFATGNLKDLLGLDPQEVLQDTAPLLNRMGAEDVERFFTSGGDSAKSMKTWHIEFCVDHPVKNKVWIEWKASPVNCGGRLAWQGFMCDVSERKQSDLALSRSEQAYRNLVERSPDFVIRYDLEHRIRYLNAKLVRELKLTSANEVLGRHPTEVWPDGRFAAIDEAAKASRETGEEITVELGYVNSDGNFEQRQILVVPEWDVNGSLIGTLAFGRDVTKYKRLEAQLTKRNAFRASSLDAVVAGGGPVRTVAIGKDITKRKRLERQPQLIQYSINQPSEMPFITDASSKRVTFVNDATCRFLGYSRKELQNMPYADIDPNYNFETAGQAILNTELRQQHMLETLHRRKDGPVFPVELNGSFFECNGHQYAPGFSRDISKGKRTENTLRFIAEHSGEQHFMTDLALHLSEALNSACVVIERFSEESAKHETTVFCANGTIYPEIHHALDDIPEKHVADNRSCYTQGMQALLPKGSLLGDMGIESYASLHLRDSTGRSNGMIAVMDTAPFHDESAVMQLLQIVAPRAAVELERAESDRQLRLREQQFRSLAENSPDNIIRYDRECRQIYANPSVVDVLMVELGRNPMGETPNQAYPDGSFREYNAALRRVIATACSEDFEYVLPDRGNGVKYQMIRMSPEKNEAGEVVGVVAFGRDITVIREGERRLRHIVDSLPGLAFSFIRLPDGQGTLPYLSAGVEALYGLKPEEAEGDMATIYNLMHPEDQPHVSAALKESARTITPIQVEFRICPPGLNPRWVDARAVPESMADGSIFWYGIMLDITERKEAQHRLYLLEYAMERMRDGSILLDRQGRILDINRGLCDMLCYEKGYLLGRSLFEFNPNFTADNWDAHWEDIVKTGGVMQIETTNRTSDGHDIPSEVSISIFEFQGKHYNLATVRDITERKQNEAQLHMAACVFEAATEGITITDPAGHILNINPAFSLISGYSRKEVLGKRPSLLASGLHDKAFYKTMWQRLLDSGSWSGEIINRRNNGELYTAQLNIVSVKDASDKTKYYVGVFTDISLLKQQEQHLQHLAQHDGLTGLPNRLLLTDRLSHAIAQAHRNDQILAIIYIDLDGFKPINDNHGHEFGDRVLVEIGHRLSVSLRTSDTVARIGGDEFVVLLAGISDIGECEFTAHRLLEMISRPIVLGGHSLNVTASIGICIYPNDAQDDPDMLLRYADQAMYLAKSAGRNQYVFYDSFAQSNARDHCQTIYDLRQALNQKQISVHFQPIIELRSGRFILAEALARWHHPQRGMVPPSEFIPAAENGGLINEIGDLVFRDSVNLVKAWSNLGTLGKNQLPHISVNRSSRQFFSRVGSDSWKSILEEKGASGELLSVEITERLLFEDQDEVQQQIQQMRNLGISISLDDFGTGYSALSYLKKFNIDYLKIDRSFIRGIVDDPDDRAIVESIIVMAKRLGIRTVAEGVETREQAEVIRNAGCDMAQGFFFARPMPEAEFLAFVADN